MTKKQIIELRQFLKDNLRIEVECKDGGEVRVTLKLSLHNDLHDDDPSDYGKRIDSSSDYVKIGRDL